MSTDLLDTSLLMDALRGRHGTVEALHGLLEADHLLACSAMTVAELLAGMRPRERKATVALLSTLEHYEITRPVAERAGLLRVEWASHGRAVALPDLLIAEVAILHGLVASPAADGAHRASSRTPSPDVPASCHPPVFGEVQVGEETAGPRRR